MATKTFYLVFLSLITTACSGSSSSEDIVPQEPPSKLVLMSWNLPAEASTSPDPKFQVVTTLKIEETKAHIETTCSMESNSVTVKATSAIKLNDIQFEITEDKTEVADLKAGDMLFPCSATIRKGIYKFRLEGKDKLFLRIVDKEVPLVRVKTDGAQ